MSQQVFGLFKLALRVYLFVRCWFSGTGFENAWICSEFLWCLWTCLDLCGLVLIFSDVVGLVRACSGGLVRTCLVLFWLSPGFLFGLIRPCCGFVFGLPGYVWADFFGLVGACFPLVQPFLTWGCVPMGSGTCGLLLACLGHAFACSSGFVCSNKLVCVLPLVGLTAEFGIAGAFAQCLTGFGSLLLFELVRACRAFFAGLSRLVGFAQACLGAFGPHVDVQTCLDLVSLPRLVSTCWVC
jgi:hypothetical protein